MTHQLAAELSPSQFHLQHVNKSIPYLTLPYVMRQVFVLVVTVQLKMVSPEWWSRASACFITSLNPCQQNQITSPALRHLYR